MSGRRAERALERIAKSDLASRARPQDRRAVDAVAADLPTAIARRELVLHYQPIVDLRSGECHRVEGLVRWTHPHIGPIDARDIVRLAAATGSLVALAIWAVEAAIRQREIWQRDDLELTVALNLAGPELCAPGPADLLRVFAAAKARPAAFTFEVPAAVLARGDPQIADGVRILAQAGARIAVDDASAADPLGRSQAMDVDELKIARAVVLRSVADPSDAMSLRRLIAGARDLGLRTVAVGVEDAVTYRFVAALGCDFAQGYWVSRPLASHDVGTWRSRGARIALGGAAVAAAYTGMARVALAGSAPAASVTTPGIGTTCCSLQARLVAQDPGVEMRESTAGGARILVEASLSASDESRIRDAVARDVAWIERELGGSFESQPSVYVFASRGSFALGLQRAFGQSATDSAALAAGNGGVAFAGSSAVAINWANVRSDAALAIVRHELSHVRVHELAGVDTELPAWLDEGLATLAERAVAPDAVAAARDASATLVLLRSGDASLQQLSSARDWTVRNALLGGRAYAVAAEAVDVLRSGLGPDGIPGLLRHARTTGFAQAFGEATGGSPADFARSFPARFASGHGGPQIAQMPAPGGVRWSVSGLTANEGVRVSIDGPGYHVAFDATADADGTYAAVFGSTAKPGDYTVTVLAGARTTSAPIRI